MIRISFGAIAAILFIVTIFFFPPIYAGGDLGLCFPSPNEWHLPRFFSWLLNVCLIVLTAALFSSANKKYNFISEADPIMPLALLLLLACSPLASCSLSSSTMLLICNALCLYIIMSTYEEPNASREFFVVGTLPAIGAMFQYSFLVMIPVYIGGGLMMKSFRFREFLAFGLGLITPYWIAIGMGVVSPMSFKFPGSLVVLGQGAVDSDVFLTLLSAAVMCVMGFILSIYNGVRLFSRNSRLRCMHMTFNLMGYVALLAIIFDFDNFMAYFGTLALWLSIEVAALLNLYEIRRPQYALLILLIVFLPIYILAL